MVGPPRKKEGITQQDQPHSYHDNLCKIDILRKANDIMRSGSGWEISGEEIAHDPISVAVDFGFELLLLGIVIEVTKGLVKCERLVVFGFLLELPSVC
jgi:hypothetical protein